MGVALEVILAGKQGLTGGAFEALTPGTGDTFSIRAFPDQADAVIEEIWGLDTASPAQLSIRSPRLHDQVRGLRLAVPDGSATGAHAEEPNLLIPGHLTVPVYSSDALTVEVLGTAADDVLFAFLVRYSDLRGAEARLHSWEEIRRRLHTVLGVLVQPTNGNGDYGTPVTLDSVDDRLKANTDYAVLGALVDTPTTLVAIAGPDTSNYRIGLPGKVEPTVGGDWFVRLDQKYGLPHIPVINANNKGSTLVYTADATTGASPNVTLILGQLR